MDRADAGRVLAGLLEAYRGRPDVVLLGLPRGGVAVAAEVARALGAPLDAFVVRKLGVPGREELAMGAIASGGVRVLNDTVIERLAISPDTVEAVATREEQELRRREEAYRGGRPPLALEGRTVILVDDGLATGSTMRAALAAVRRRGPARVVVAAPTGAPVSVAALRQEADEVVCPLTPLAFLSVGQFYDEFSPTSDDEVRALVGHSPVPPAAGPPTAPPSPPEGR